MGLEGTGLGGLPRQESEGDLGPDGTKWGASGLEMGRWGGGERARELFSRPHSSLARSRSLSLSQRRPGHTLRQW